MQFRFVALSIMLKMLTTHVMCYVREIASLQKGRICNKLVLRSTLAYVDWEYARWDNAGSTGGRQCYHGWLLHQCYSCVSL